MNVNNYYDTLLNGIEYILIEKEKNKELDMKTAIKMIRREFRNMGIKIYRNNKMAMRDLETLCEVAFEMNRQFS